MSGSEGDGIRRIAATQWTTVQKTDSVHPARSCMGRERGPGGHTEVLQILIMDFATTGQPLSSRSPSSAPLPVQPPGHDRLSQACWVARNGPSLATTSGLAPSGQWQRGSSVRRTLRRAKILGGLVMRARLRRQNPGSDQPEGFLPWTNGAARKGDVCTLAINQGLLKGVGKRTGKR